MTLRPIGRLHKILMWANSHAVITMTSLLILLILILGLLIGQCSKIVEEAGGMSGIVSDIIVDTENFVSNVRDDVKEKRAE